MPQLFGPGANTLARLGLVILVLAPLFALAALIAWRWSPFVTGQGEMLVQPVPFSHKHHVGEMGIDCRYCHTTVERTAFAGMPTTHICMSCHSQLFTDASMLAPVRHSLATGKPLVWNRVYRLPDYVYFDHSIHVAKGIGCAECHGPVHDMPFIRQQAPLTMGWCLSCHRDPGPHLRAFSQITDTSFIADDDVATAEAFLRAYQIHPKHLTDCAVCHR